MWEKCHAMPNRCQESAKIHPLERHDEVGLFPFEEQEGVQETQHSPLRRPSWTLLFEKGRGTFDGSLFQEHCLMNAVFSRWLSVHCRGLKLYEFHMSLRKRKGKVDLVGVEAKATSNVNDNDDDSWWFMLIHDSWCFILLHDDDDDDDYCYYHYIYHYYYDDYDDHACMPWGLPCEHLLLDPLIGEETRQLIGAWDGSFKKWPNACVFDVFGRFALIGFFLNVANVEDCKVVL